MPPVDSAFVRLISRTREALRRMHAGASTLRSAGVAFRQLPENLAALERTRLNQARIARSIAFMSTRASEDPWQLLPASCLCTEAHCASPIFAEWCQRLAIQPLFNRKTWEYAYAAAVLDAVGVLHSGSRGVGFGVGREPLPAYLAARGCSVVATDQSPTSRDAARWEKSGQYAGAIEGLRRATVCDSNEFAQRVEFRVVDMKAIPNDLTGFDFCWSLCALEHLGSLEEGLRFIERSLACLRPGGVAVHTMELNISSDDRTVTRGPTVLYRKSDVASFAALLESRGHRVARLDLATGEGILDEYVDGPPWLAWSEKPHLRVSIEGFVTTSFALVITSASDGPEELPSNEKGLLSGDAAEGSGGVRTARRGRSIGP